MPKNKYLGYSVNERLQAAKELGIQIADMVIPFDTAWNIYKKITIALNIHPNIEAWFAYNPFFDEILDARNRYEELYGHLPLVSPECECGSKSHECHCLDSFNSLYNSVQNAKNNYDSIRNANYINMVNWIDAYYNSWFRDEYGEQITHEINQEFINELKRMSNECMKEIGLIIAAAEAVGSSSEIEEYQRLKNEINLSFADNTKRYISDYDDIINKAIKDRADSFFPTHEWIEQGNLEKIIGIHPMPEPSGGCSCASSDLGQSNPDLGQPKPGALPTPRPVSPGSPLILDLNNDGVKTIGIEDGVYFDHGGDRFAEKSGWVDPNDALLVVDKNKNGIIDDGSELFGNNSILSNDSKAANGFVALAEFDSNRDGVVNQKDGRWSELKLWQDRNGDGKIDDGELLTLEEAGVSGLNVRYVNQSHKDENGNDHRQVGSFIRDDGSVGTMTDVWFARDSIDTEYLDDVEIPDDIKMLPNLKGWGSVRDMHQVMATDETGRLKALMEQYLASDTLAGRGLVWDIIFAWTGVTDISPDFYPQYWDDSRMLLAVERLTGSRFGVPDDSTRAYTSFSGFDDVALEEYYNDWGDKVSAYLLLSTRYNALYNLALAGNAVFEISEDVSAYEPLLNVLRAIHASDGLNAKFMIADFINALRKYDSKGIACANILKEAFSDPHSEDEFIKDMSLGWMHWIPGMNSADTLSGGASDDFLYGNMGDDTLRGDSGNDILWGGAGNDRLEGGDGSDIYLFGKGDGHDVISEGDARSQPRNVVRLGEGIGVDYIELLIATRSTAWI